MWFWLFADQPAPGAPSPNPGNPGAPGSQPKVPGGPGGPPGEEGEEEDDAVGSEINTIIENSIPWMASILFHLGIIILALFIYFVVVPKPADEEEMPIVPIAKLSKNPGGEIKKTESTDLKATQNQRKVESQDTAKEESLQNLNNTAAEKTSLLGASGGGGGGKLAPYGNTLGTGVGVGAKFYGAGGNARRIVYVVDASGSLIDSLPFVLQELKRSISELVDVQGFSVIFFQENKAIESPPLNQLKKATQENKLRINQWMDPTAGFVVPHGSSNPMAALKAAMQLKPELLFILSDNITGTGKYEVDQREIMEELDKMNKDRKIVINTIQFLYPDPLDTLKKIATEHGGIYKMVKRSDLGIE